MPGMTQGIDIASIHSAAREGGRVVGWSIAADAREALLVRFPARYARVVADHVTLRAKVASDTPLPDAVTAQIVGVADDDLGVQALVIAIHNETTRPDGGTWHITWSLEEGREARESNDVLAVEGWTAVEFPVEVALAPAMIR